MGVKSFTELAAWQRASELRTLVLELVARPSVAKDFRFCDQGKAAARSVPNNIAEGFGRDQLFEAHERCYISDSELANADLLIGRTVASCAGLERYLRSTTAPPSRTV